MQPSDVKRVVPTEIRDSIRERLPWTLYGTLPLDGDELASFAAQNRQYWADFMSPVEDNSQGEIIVDLRTYNLQAMQNVCTIVNYIARERNLEPVYLVDTEDPNRTELIRSYYPGEILSVGHLTLPFQLLAASSDDPALLATAARKFSHAVRSIDSISDLCSWTIDGFPVGNLVYSAVRRKNREGTYDSMNAELYLTLYCAYLMYERWQKIFDERPVEAVTSVHFVYLWRGLFGRLALANDCDTYVFWGGRGSVRRYSSLDNCTHLLSDPSPELFEELLENHRDLAVQQAHEVLTDRFGVSPTDVVIGDRVRTSEGTPPLLDVFSLPPDNPTVLILPKIFIEKIAWDPHFQDHLTWFREAIRHATDHDEINWLVKPHPNRDFYDTKQTVADEVATITDGQETTIRVLPDETSRAAIIDATDAVTTPDGTAGIEYPCYGIPAIMAGNSGYAEFGFTHNTSGKAAYLDALTDVGTLEPLSEAQRTWAKIVCYHKAVLIKNNFRTYDENRSTYENACAFLDNESPADDPLYRDVETFVTRNNRFLYDTDLLGE